MNLHRYFSQSSHATLVALALASSGIFDRAWAAPVGLATDAQSNTSGRNGGASYAIAKGTRVNNNDVIETDGGGRARLQFFDQTLLAIGPNSSVKLDNFVVRQDGGMSSMALAVSRGAFRFASGRSGSPVYRIVTPAGTIGVRGTRFNFSVENGRLQVAVTEGAVQLCHTGGVCREARRGQTLTLSGGRFALENRLTNFASVVPALGGAVANIGRALTPPVVGNTVQQATWTLPRVAPSVASGAAGGLARGASAPVGAIGSGVGSTVGGIGSTVGGIGGAVGGLGGLGRIGR